MATLIEDHEKQYKGRPSYNKKFGGEEYFWCGKYKDKRKGGVLLHLAAVAGNTGFRYRIEKLSEINKFTFTKQVRYNLWIRRK